MTLLNIRHAVEILIAFNEAKKKSTRLYEEAGQISQQLADFSGMHRVRKTLENIMEDMEEEAVTTNLMVKCLEETCKSCIRYEEYITDHAEEAKAVNLKNYILGTLDIPDVIFTLLR